MLWIKTRALLIFCCLIKKTLLSVITIWKSEDLIRLNIQETAQYTSLWGNRKYQLSRLHKQFQETKLAEIDGQKIYLGDYLFRHCERLILELHKQVGIVFITLNSTEQGYHLYHDRNSYMDFDNDMSTFVDESDYGCHKLYKCADDIIEPKN